MKKKHLNKKSLPTFYPFTPNTSYALNWFGNSISLLLVLCILKLNLLVLTLLVLTFLAHSSIRGGGAKCIDRFDALWY